MRKLVSSLSMLVAATVLSTSAVHAQEIALSGPLKDAPSVRRLKEYRNQRFELALQPTFTLLDEYRHTVFMGVRAQYHFTDWLGVGLFGAFGAASITTDLTDQLDTSLAKADQPLEILRTLHSFDPCLACSTHVMSPDGAEMTRVKVR